MTSVLVRHARKEDVDTILDLWETAAENSGRPADTRVSLVELLQRDSAALLVATSAERLVGSIIAGWDGWRGHLYRLAVHPEYRRQGVGGVLLSAAETRLTALGAVRFDAMVSGDNQLGRQLWTAAGYRQQDDWRRWVKSA